MRNVIDFNRIQLDRAIANWKETGKLEYNTNNKALVGMIESYFMVLSDLNAPHGGCGEK